MGRKGAAAQTSKSEQFLRQYHGIWKKVYNQCFDSFATLEDFLYLSLLVFLFLDKILTGQCWERTCLFWERITGQCCFAASHKIKSVVHALRYLSGTSPLSRSRTGLFPAGLSKSASHNVICCLWRTPIFISEEDWGKHGEWAEEAEIRKIAVEAWQAIFWPTPCLKDSILEDTLEVSRRSYPKDTKVSQQEMQTFDRGQNT